MNRQLEQVRINEPIPAPTTEALTRTLEVGMGGVKSLTETDQGRVLVTFTGDVKTPIELWPSSVAWVRPVVASSTSPAPSEQPAAPPATSAKRGGRK